LDGVQWRADPCEHNNENPEYSKEKYLWYLKVYIFFYTDCTVCNLLVGWLVGLLFGSLVSWFVCYLLVCLVCYLVGWLADWLVNQLVS
jgi:hypothetical protein